MSAQFRKLTCGFTLLLALVLSGCFNTSGGTPTAASTEAATQVPDMAYTQAAETIIAELTANPPAATEAPEQPAEAPPPESQTEEPLPATSTPLPTDTPMPTDTLMPTDTPLPSDTPLPTESPTATTPPEPVFSMVFQDDFSSGVGWPVFKLDTVRAHYTMGGYVILNKIKKDVAWSTRSEQYANLRVEVTGSRVSGPLDGGYYGPICRFADGGNYYLFAVGSDGWYGIGKRMAGKMEFLEEGYDSNNAVHTGNAPNLIRGDCVGNMLTMWVNGVKVAQVEDSSFSAGAAGLGVGTLSEFDYEVLFDDFIIYEPE